MKYNLISIIYWYIHLKENRSLFQPKGEICETDIAECIRGAMHEPCQPPDTISKIVEPKHKIYKRLAKLFIFKLFYSTKRWDLRDGHRRVSLGPVQKRWHVPRSRERLQLHVSPKIHRIHVRHRPVSTQPVHVPGIVPGKVFYDLWTVWSCRVWLGVSVI